MKVCIHSLSEHIYVYGLYLTIKSKIILYMLIHAILRARLPDPDMENGSQNMSTKIWIISKVEKH